MVYIWMKLYSLETYCCNGRNFILKVSFWEVKEKFNFILCCLLFIYLLLLLFYEPVALCSMYYYYSRSFLCFRETKSDVKLMMLNFNSFRMFTSEKI